MASELAGVTGRCARSAGSRLLAGGAALALLAIGSLGPGGTASAAPGAVDSADRLIFWTGCASVVSLNDAQLDTWKARGVDGFVCMGDRLRGLGGSQDFSADPNASLSGANYELQRSLRDSRIVERASARGMKLYLGVKLSNYFNTATPLKDWFDDAGWSGQVLPRMRDAAGAARDLGFAGLAFDQELYAQRNGVKTATWAWDYPGNTRAEAQVRARAKQRGEQLMSAILDAYPGAELAVYHYGFPGDWEELVQEEVNGHEDFSADLLHIDFWDGMTNAEGYGAIRFFDNAFYKAPHRGSWESALTYNQNRVLATLSRRFTNWDYASSRVYISPFSWIDPGPNASSSFDDARPPTYVRDQLLAFRKWGMGGEFANYTSRSLGGFDYSPYVSGMQAASSPGTVDATDPTLQVTSSASGSTPPALIEGRTQDNLAIRAVRWRDDRGGSGVAEMTWSVLSGSYGSGYVWETRWSFPAADLAPGATQVTITAEDIKGRTSSPGLLSWSLGPDAIPPETSITAAPSGTTVSTSAQFSFGSNEGGSSFECRLEGIAWSGCSSPKAYAGLLQGQHTFETRAVDAAGNVDPTPAVRDWTIDSLAPNTSISAGPSGSTSATTASFSYSASEAGSSFRCKLDSAPWVSCPGSGKTYAGLASGSHTFKVRAADAAGNVDPTPASRSFTVRASGRQPMVTKKPPKRLRVTGRMAEVRFQFSSPEPAVAYLCRLDGGRWHERHSGSMAFEIRAKRRWSRHRFEVASVDSAGSATAPVRYRFRVRRR